MPVSEWSYFVRYFFSWNFLNIVPFDICNHAKTGQFQHLFRSFSSLGQVFKGRSIFKRFYKFSIANLYILCIDSNFNGTKLFLDLPSNTWNSQTMNETIERMHSVPRDSNNKGHGGHVSVPNKRGSKFFCWGTPKWQLYDVKCVRSIIWNQPGNV